MPLTYPIPKLAMSVVRTLRKDVRRPKALPVFDANWQCLRWKPDKNKINSVCPMGLHPKSIDPLPLISEEFAHGNHADVAVQAFLGWWDNQIDASAAVNAVWPRKRKKAKPSRKGKQCH